MKINFIDVGSCGNLCRPWKGGNFKHIDYCLKIDPLNEKNKVVKKNIYYKCAAFEKEGMFPFYICSKKFNSSLFMPNYKVIAEEDKDRFIVEEIKDIKCMRIENIISETGINFDFIKIDTQGSDLAVLKGLGDFIDDLVGIHLEAYFIQMYEAMPLLKDINEYLESKNFTQVKSLRKKKNNIFDDFLYLKLDKNKNKLDLVKNIYGI